MQIFIFNVTLSFIPRLIYGTTNTFDRNIIHFSNLLKKNYFDKNKSDSAGFG